MSTLIMRGIPKDNAPFATTIGYYATNSSKGGKFADMGVGDKQRSAIRPEFDRSIRIDFQGARSPAIPAFFSFRWEKTSWHPFEANQA